MKKRKKPLQNATPQLTWKGMPVVIDNEEQDCIKKRISETLNQWFCDRPDNVFVATEHIYQLFTAMLLEELNKSKQDTEIPSFWGFLRGLGHRK